MSHAPVVFAATGEIQSYFVPAAGTYLIEAAGAQGGPGGAPGRLGSRLTGMFLLRRGNQLKIVAGTQGLPASPPHELSGGNGGASLVWIGPTDLPSPIKLMLSARGGAGGGPAAAHAAGDSADIALESAVLDASTAGALITQWTLGTKSPAEKKVGKPAGVDREGYNVGAFRTSASDFQAGDGRISITPVSATKTPAAPAPPADAAPSSQVPRVLPRLSAWQNLLRRRDDK